MGASDLLTLTNAFSGIQLVVLVYVLMEIRHLTAAQQRLAEQAEKKADDIEAINSRLSRVMGRLNIPTGED